MDEEQKARDRIERKEADGSVTQVNGDGSQMTTDKHGHVTSITRTNGYTVKVSYDETGREKELRFEDRSWKKVGSTWNQYDRKGKRVDSFGGDFAISGEGDVAILQKDNSSTVYHLNGSTTEIGTDGSRIVVDGEGRLISVTRANGHTAQITYDKKGNPRELKFKDRTWEKANGFWNQLDTNGKKVASFEGDFAVTAGGDVAILNADGSSVILHPDCSTTETNADKSQIKIDGDNRVTSITHPNGETNSFEYDEHGNPARITVSDGSIWMKGKNAWNQYDRGGKKIDQLDGDFHITEDGDLIAAHHDGSKKITHMDGQVETRVAPSQPRAGQAPDH